MPIDDIAPFIIGFGLVVVLPIVAIMTKHQRHMAELLGSRGQTQDNSAQILAQLERMQTEIQGLKDKQNEIILALEDRTRPPALSERVRE